MSFLRPALRPLARRVPDGRPSRPRLPRRDRAARAGATSSAPSAPAAVSAEPLEERAMLTFYLVTTTQDVVARDGEVSLREAVTAANANRSFFDAAAGQAGVNPDGSAGVLDRIRISTQLIQPGGAGPVFQLNDTITFSDSAVLLATGATFDGSLFVGPLFDVQLEAREQVVFDSAVYRNAVNDRDGGAISYTGVNGAIAPSSSVVGIRRGRFMNNTAVNDLGFGRGGAVAQRGGRMLIRDVSFVNNTAELHGGAIESLDGGQLTVTDSVFQTNSALRDGGAIDTTGAFTTILSSRFLGNTVGGPSDLGRFGRGGAIGTFVNFDQFPQARTVIRDSLLLGNTSSSRGGGLYTDIRTQVIDSVIDRNSASGSGGGVDSEGPIALVGTDVVGNTTVGNGGGIRVSGGGRFELVDSNVRANTAFGNRSPSRTLSGGGFGGGVFALGGTFIARDSRIVVNQAGRLDVADDVVTAQGNGGGIYAFAADVLIDNTVVRQNRALGRSDPALNNNAMERQGFGDGGGMQLFNGATAQVVNNSIFSDNTATHDGGGIIVGSAAGVNMNPATPLPFDGLGLSTLVLDATVQVIKNVTATFRGAGGGGGILAVGMATLNGAIVDSNTPGDAVGNIN